MSWCGEIRYAIVRTRDKWRAEIVYSCVSWADQGSYQCAQYATEVSQQCASYADEGYQACSSWADEGSNQCCDWWPCSWGCQAFYWVANWVCQGWYWVSNIVCQLWVDIVSAVCVAWFWVAKLVCRIFAYVLYLILTVIAYLVWYVLYILCRIFGPQQPLSGPIQHIFVLVLENRSFDHMLGMSTVDADDWATTPSTGADAVTLQATALNGAQQSINTYDGKGYGVRSGAPFVMPVDPPHEFCDVQLQLTSTPISGKPLDDHCDYSGIYPALTMAGFVRSYANQASTEGNAQALGDLGAVMACFTHEQVPVISTLAREFAVCDTWYSALPGPTWPNRFFLHAATSGGLDNSPGTWDVILSQVDGYQFENGAGEVEALAQGDRGSLTPSVRGFIETAAIVDARLHPADRDGVRQRMASIRTLEDARRYMSDVAAQLNDHVAALRRRNSA
jgi:phospholipase C